jgi:ribosomal protein L16 Arg81 hydroxylase
MSAPAIASLEDLIAPLSAAEFIGLLRSRSIRFQRNPRDNCFAGLLTWQAFRSLIEGGVVPTGELRITKDETAIPPIFYLESGKVAAAKLERLMSHGASIVVAELNPYVPALETLCAAIRERTAETIMAGAIATTGDGGALRIHYDEDDLFIVQLEGSKRWRIYGPPVAYPVLGMATKPAPTSEPVFDEVLKPGDMLFLPAGYWHRCNNEQDLSLHLGIFFRPITTYYAVKSLLPNLIDDEIFRLPLSRSESAADRAALEAEIRARLLDQFEKLVSSPSFFGAGKPKPPTT